MVDPVAGELDRVHERSAGRFGRAEPRTRVRECVSGLVEGLERKNGWTLAEHAGEAGPDGMRRLLRRPRQKKGGRYQRSRHDRLHVTGDTPPAEQPRHHALT